MLYYPEHINIETSDYCNRRCDYCPIQRDRDTHPPRLLDLAILEKLLLELQRSPFPLKISLQWIDEPLANPEFLQYADLCRKLLPDAKLLVQTNGDFLTETWAEELKHRFDAMVVNFYGEKAHTKYLSRNIDFVPATHPNRIQSPGRLKRAKGYEDRTKEAIVHLNEKYHNRQWVQHHDRIQVSPSARCMRLWVQAAIGYDGSVYICCRDNLKAHPVGNLQERSLLECYNSKTAQELRNKMEQGEREQIAMCATCPGAYGNRFRQLSLEETNTLSENSEEMQCNVSKSAHESQESKALPYGLYEYWHARRLAREKGHIALPGYHPLRYEYVVGLTPELAEHIVTIAQEVLGDSLMGLWVCGSRVITRTHLEKLDTSVFTCEYPLSIGKKTHLREYGPNPRLSSDLDLKILVNAETIDRNEARPLGETLGKRLAKLSPFIPLSGHLQPFLRLIRVPRQCKNAHEAFDFYNANRPIFQKKGPLSLEYTQLLFDPQNPGKPWEQDSRLEVQQQLIPHHEASQSTNLSGLKLPQDFLELSEASKLQSRHLTMTGHQWIGALLDFPSFDPLGIEWGPNQEVTIGSTAVWAMRQARRTTLHTP